MINNSLLLISVRNVVWLFVNSSSCLAGNTANNQNNTFLPLNNVLQSPYPSIKYHGTTTNKIENLIKSLKSSNSFGYDEVPDEFVKIMYFFISSP